ncbi:MAG: DUF3078 domain-containing protein [Prevotella sp.]|nr:DUF3078 domain-containing protein [Prevotella sp.]
MKRFYASALIILAALPMWGQNKKAVASVDTMPKVVRQYQDSLMAYKAKLDSLQTIDNQNNALFSKLFLPVTYYNDVSHNALSLEGKGTANYNLNTALMNLYLTRPDLVAGTEDELKKIGATAAQIEAAKNTKVELVEKKAEKPVEPEPAPVTVVVKKPNFWTYKGDGYLQFLQNYVSGNWYKGGESNYSMLSSLTLEANYDNKSKWKWDNKLEMKLGFQTSRSDSINRFKANEDLIRLTSKLGLQATKHWYYTLQLLAYTQFTRGLKSNDRRTYSDFMSPFNLNLGLGMDYKVEWLNKKLTGTVNISPLAVNYRYVDRRIFRKNDTETQWFPSRHGLEDQRHSLTDFGSQFTIDLLWKIAENIKWKTRMYGFTSYKRVQYEWENTFTFQFNKYISSNIFVYPRFDDNTARDGHHGYWQFKEYVSIGFNYSF